MKAPSPHRHGLGAKRPKLVGPLRRLDALCAAAERSIALLDRSRPLDAKRETERLRELVTSGRPRNPSFRYAPAPDLGELRGELERAALVLENGDAVAQEYAARLRELELEARLAEAVGGPEFSRLARLRYPVDTEEAGLVEQAEAWTRHELTAPEGELWASDDASSESSLLNQMSARIGALGLPIRVLVERELQSVAATAEDAVLIKPGVFLSPREARRIVVHELLGHVLPRIAAKGAPLGLFRVGSAGGADDEEGRALSCERRAGLFGSARQAELGRRHLAALGVARGADWVETVRLLLELGASERDAVDVACRVQRGGGLARELVYLPALARVERALECEPELENWLAAGRVSVRAAKRLRRGCPALASALALRSVPEFHE